MSANDTRATAQPPMQHGNDVVGRDPGDCESGQALGKGAQDRHAIALREVKRADENGGADHRDQDARYALAAPQQQDYRQRTRPDR